MLFQRQVKYFLNAYQTFECGPATLKNVLNQQIAEVLNANIIDILQENGKFHVTLQSLLQK